MERTVNAAQDAHLARILDVFQTEASTKYRQGQQEHGGNLWEKPGLLDEAIREAIDQVIYLVTLRDQLQGKYDDHVTAERTAVRV